MTLASAPDRLQDVPRHHRQQKVAGEGEVDAGPDLRAHHGGERQQGHRGGGSKCEEEPEDEALPGEPGGGRGGVGGRLRRGLTP